MTTPPASRIHRITESPPQFPCWIWHVSMCQWCRFDNFASEPLWGYSHWHRDQPNAPTVTPEPTAPTETPEEGKAHSTAADHISGPMTMRIDSSRLVAAPQPSAEVEEMTVQFRDQLAMHEELPELTTAQLSTLLLLLRRFASRVRQTAPAPVAQSQLMKRIKEFLDECAVAEDRSNLDGDSAEVVLEQINDEAETLLDLLKAEPSPVAQPSNDAAERAAECDVLSGKLVRLGTFLIGHEGNLDEVTGYFVASTREEIKALRYVPTFGRVRIVPESAETSSTPAAPLPKDVAEAVKRLKKLISWLMTDPPAALNADAKSLKKLEKDLRTLLAALQSGGGDRDRLDAMLGMANAALTRLRAVVDAADRMEEPVRELMVWVSVACGFGAHSRAEQQEAYDLMKKITDLQTAYRAAKEKKTP